MCGASPLRCGTVRRVTLDQEWTMGPMSTPHPYGQYPPPVYQPAPRRPWSHLAISGFVASLIGLGLIGLPVSIAGVVVTQRKPWYKGSGLAIVGIFLGLFWSYMNIQFIGGMLGWLTV